MKSEGERGHEAVSFHIWHLLGAGGGIHLFGGYQLFDFSRRWYLAGASIALVLAVLVCILVHQNDRLEALEKRTRQLEEQIQKQND